MEPINNKNIVGFWRRFAALWIDVFVIYSMTKLIIVLLSVPGFRISFETLFIISGAFYTSVMLHIYRQTVGKMLMGINVTSKTGEPIYFRDILVREVFGKWIMTVSVPIMLGMILIGNRWLPTVSAMLVMIPVILICIIYFMVRKNMWYEHLAGLTVIRIKSLKKVKLGFYFLIIAAIAGAVVTTAEFLIKKRVPCRMAAYQNINSIRPYVSFLKEHNTTPVDYVIGLFDTCDVVVLCERAHPEMTQWEFIYDVIRDPRFIAKAGNVFTEYGQAGMQDYLDQFMMTDGLTEKEVHDRVISIMRNMPVWPSWTNFNLYKYLKRLYYLNQTLPPENRVRHHFTDAAVDWSAITTKEKFKEYQKNFLWNRDEIMANTIIEKMKDLAGSSDKPPKCLVVMNYRHAMDLTDRLPGVTRVNTFEFLKDHFGSRAVNVLINSRIILTVPVAGGVWDAAFEKTGNKPVGFDFQGSPFGACNFDMFPWDIIFSPLKHNNSPSSNGNLRFRDVFKGFVFTHPTKDQYLQESTPGYFDGFEKEYIRRSACLSDESGEAAKLEMQSLKQGSQDPIHGRVDFTIETMVELCFYGFAGIGFLIGLVAFIFRPRKMIV